MDKKELYKGIGERLREYRDELHYTQEYAAELLEISMVYYGRIERGENGISLPKMLLAHENMNVDIEYLLTGKRKHTYKLEELLASCPPDKRYEMEVLIKYALELAKK